MSFHLLRNIEGLCRCLGINLMNSSVKKKPKLTLVTTVPETIVSILRDQPKYLKDYFDVSIITSPGSLLKIIQRNEGVKVKAVSMERGINPLKDVLSIINMALYLRRLRPEIVHSYTPKAGLVTMLAAWLCGVPLRVHTFTGLIFPTATGFKQKILIWVDRLICGCATHIVPEGTGVKRDLQNYRITRKPLKVIGHGNIAGVDTNYFDPESTDFSSSTDELRRRIDPGEVMVFCFVGRLNKDKGIDELCAAFDLIPESAHLLLVGGLDQSAPISEGLQKKIKGNPRIHSLGFIEDIRPALGLADVLVLPSYREGFPNVVLQAGSMGLPVIATDINGCNEIIDHEFNGWLVPPRDAEALSVAMLRAMQTPESLRKEIGKRARERVQQRFEQRQHWERIKLFYQKLDAADEVDHP